LAKRRALRRSFPVRHPVLCSPNMGNETFS